jgi:hypothetical protein
VLGLDEVWTDGTHPATSDAPAAVRRVVARELAAHHVALEVTELAELLVSELVANVVVHVGGQLRVWVGRAAQHVYLAVEDEAPDRLPLVQPASSDARAGRGMLLVDVLAVGWGYLLGERTKIVWCAIALSSSPDAVTRWPTRGSGRR